MTVPALQYSLASYSVTEKETSLCPSCNKLIVWLKSYRTGKKYPVDTKPVDGEICTARNWFHKCDKVVHVAPVQLPLTLPTPSVPVAQFVPPVRNTKAEWRRAMVSYIEQASESQLRSALMVIFNRQTSGEQASNTTTQKNSIGFTGLDADILSDIYKKSLRWGVLKGRQVDFVRRKMKSYSRQLVDAREKGEWWP